MGAAGAGAGPSSPQWKTTLCKNYQEDGRYLLDACSFLSSSSCLLALDYAQETRMDDTYDRCEFGGRCQFAHGQLELRTLAQNYLQLNPQVSTDFNQVLHCFPLCETLQHYWFPSTRLSCVHTLLKEVQEIVHRCSQNFALVTLLKINDFVSG